MAMAADDDRRALARMLDRAHRAREDVDAFIEFIGEGPGGRRLKQDPVHIEWQQFWAEKKRSVMLAPVGHGKTTGLRHRLLWEIGRNPNIQIAYVSATERHPKKVARAMKSEIERNRRVRYTFPHLRRGAVWTSTEFEVQRTTRDPDPTFQLFGAFSQSVLGSRADFVVFDDLCNDSNTLTEYARERMDEWVAEVISRLKPTARVMAIGHIWHDHDQLQRWSRLKNWGYKRYEATSPDPETGEPAILPDGTPSGIPLAPQVMSLADIREKADDLKIVRTLMMLYNRLASRQLGRFKQSWFDRCLERGKGLGFLTKAIGAPMYTGVDLGHRKTPGSDLTVLFTIAVLPDGTRQIVDIRSGLWRGPEILHQLKQVYHCFGSQIAVENNGAQQYILDFAEDLMALPVRPHHTGVNKHDLAHGIESLGVEMSQGRWMLPCSEHLEPLPEVMKFINECLTYDPTRHTGDRLIAAWIAREAARMSPAAPAGIEIEHVDVLTR